jgi:hypothetical protein
MNTLQCLTCSLGYKLREKIGKALKTRSEAIRTALNQYNAAAVKLKPPRPQLSWASVLKAVTVADSDLLRDTRSDIRSLPWAEPSRREALGLYFGIKRAREEIIRLNVEIKRLLTFMLDTHSDYYRAVAANIIVDPTVAHSLSVEWEYQDSISQVVVNRLIQTSLLPGFSGSLSFGKRTDRDPSLNIGVPLPQWAVLTSGNDNTRTSRSDIGNDTEEVLRELDVDTELVIQFVERINILETSL